MKNIKLNIVYILSVLLLISSCETTELDLRESPNGASPNDANVALLLNGAMINFKDFNEELTDFGMQVTRMTHMSGPVYDNAYSPQNLNDLSTAAYAGVLSDTRAVIKKGTKEGLYEHVAIAKILESYTASNLVDMFGDVPYSEAIKFNNNFNPAIENGQSIYTKAITLLDEAISDFGKSSLQNLNKADDIFYGGDKSKWIRLANTLKLRLLNNMRLVSSDKESINAIISDGNIITNTTDDFQVSYGTGQNDPDVRHFKFVDNYVSDDNREYMATYFMNLLNNGKTIVDPRMRYYFYRQTLTYPDPSTNDGLFTMPCLGKTKPIHYGFNTPFCNIGEGYWGRDHGDNDGGPPDGNKISVWGLYPIGGKYDNNEGSPVKASDGARGAGIMPIWTASNTHFLLAESALTIGTNGDPKKHLEEGMKASFTKVLNFNTEAIPESANTPTQVNIDTYINEVLANFDSATNEDKLNIIMTEAFIANWCNGIEVYNNYRRTGKPDNLQPTLSATPGNYIRSFYYPANMVDRNSNISPKSGVDVRVFWDTNTDNLNF